jgi:hypothetical protein
VEGEVLDRTFRSASSHPRPDIGSIITGALKAAGLMKG